jgi:D-3-phosphoglycerate dehydrogenase
LMKAVVVDSKIIDMFTSFDIEKDVFARENIEFAVENVTSPDEYIRLCRDADALLLIGTETPREVIGQLPNCKVIVRYGVGYDVVDVESCSVAGIVVCNVPDAGTMEVGGHALALALDCLRKITYYDRQIRRGNWHPRSGYILRRYSAYTFGYCGFGNIGRAAAKFASQLGCRLIAYDPCVEDEVFAAAGVTRVNFDELLAQSDLISIHAPLTKTTYHLFSKEQFNMMKPGVIIINTSRGGLVCQEDLMDAIDRGIVAAAGLDVNEQEPLTDLGSRLLSYDTVVLTPHSATESLEYFATLQEKVARTAVAVLRGDLPGNTVNREAILRWRNQK